MARKINWLQNGKGNLVVSHLLSYLVFFGIILGMTYYYADRFGEYFHWLLENDYINETQCSLLNQSTDLGMIIIVPNIVQVTLTAFVLFILIQKGILILFLPKKQLLEKVISFNSAIDQLDILYNEKAIDFVKNNKIKIYLVDNPFSRKEEIRENCFAKYIYYAGNTTYFNKGKIEQYIGQNKLCFDYNDFVKYKDELKNYKDTILEIELEKNNKKHEEEIDKIKSENNKREHDIIEKYEKKFQDMQDTINRKDNQLLEEITARENYKNKFFDCELNNKELSAKIQEIQRKEMSDMTRYTSRASYYFFMSITNNELQGKNSDRTYTNKEIKDYFWNVINRYSDNFPNLKKEMKQLLKQDINDEQNPYKFPSWAEDYIKLFVEQRQTKGGRPRNNV